MTEPTYTDRLRVRLRERMNACPTCGAPTDIPIARVASESGVASSTVGRFLRGDVVESTTIDRLEAWLGDEWRARFEAEHPGLRPLTVSVVVPSDFAQRPIEEREDIRTTAADMARQAIVDALDREAGAHVPC